MRYNISIIPNPSGFATPEVDRVNHMGTLYIVSTPIGNLEDISIRALKILATVGVIACEDTRVTGLLVSELAKRYPQYWMEHTKPEFVSYRDANEQSVTPELIARLIGGTDIALVSDAGTPLVSDPGLRLVQAAGDRSIPVVAVPGPSAFVAALTASGLPGHSVMFLGFLPEKKSHRERVFTGVVESSGFASFTYCFYVSPHDLNPVLSDMMGILGDIPIVVVRELTKVHEEIYRGSISACRTHFNAPKGEFVVLFRFRHPQPGSVD